LSRFKNNSKNKNLMHAIILAGGFGTRLKPYTDSLPKPMLSVQNIPILEHHVQSLKSHGITHIIISTGYLAQTIQDYFGDGKKWDVHITYSHEDTPLGTGGAVKQAILNQGINNELILIWGDNVHDINYTELRNSHNSEVADITMVLTHRTDIEHFGVADFTDEHKHIISSFVEKPSKEQAPSNWINAGVFILKPRLLTTIKQTTFSIEKDCFEKVVVQKRMHAHFHHGQWFPTDTVEKYHLAQAFRRK
jgi:NDP-sugar pyrophosphorylase family protein